MAPCRRTLVLVLGLVVATICAGYLSTPSPCACKNTTSIALVIVDACTGSTWCGQLLDNHPCSHGFIARDSRPDGHWRPKEPQAKKPKKPGKFHVSVRKFDIANQLRVQLGRQPKGPRGVLLTWKLGQRLLNQKKTDKVLQRALSPHFPAVIVAWTRLPFYVALCRAKKAALRTAKSTGGLKRCREVGQVGSDLCKVENFTFSLDPQDFDRWVQNITADMTMLVETAKRLAKAFDAKLHTSSYVATACASARVLNTLPKEMLEAVALPTSCDSKISTRARKVTPSLPGSQIRNLDEVLAWADAHGRPDWRTRFTNPETHGVCSPPSRTSELVPPPWGVEP